jgi:hypothetical protein
LQSSWQQAKVRKFWLSRGGRPDVRCFGIAASLMRGFLVALVVVMLTAISDRAAAEDAAPPGMRIRR